MNMTNSRIRRILGVFAALGTTVLVVPAVAADPDLTPPTVSAAVTSPSGVGSMGWYPGTITVVLSAADNVAVQDITWEAQGAYVSGPTTVGGSTVSIPVTASGQTSIIYWATDTSANVSDVHYMQVGVDPAARPVVSISSETTVLEPDDTSSRGAYFMFNLSKPAVANIIVSYYTEEVIPTTSCNVSTAPNCDFLRFGTFASPRTLTIPAGQKFGTLAVPVLPDALIEDNEYFLLIIKSVSANAVVGQNTGQALIYDVDSLSDGGKPVLMLTPKQSAIESNVGEVKGQVFISVSKALTAAVSIPAASGNLTATGNPLCTTAPGTDYRSRTQTFPFPIGTKQATFDVLICPDTTVENDEEMQVTYTPIGSPPDSLVQILTPANIEIIDDDAVQDAVL